MQPKSADQSEKRTQTYFDALKNHMVKRLHVCSADFKWRESMRVSVTGTNVEEMQSGIKNSIRYHNGN